jgi:pimeloyl-ACP methyl ester carboxylesterase
MTNHLFQAGIDEHDSPSVSRRRMLQISALSSAILTVPQLARAAMPPAIVRPHGEAVVPFKVDIPQSAIDDLKLRLRHTRWPEHETKQGWVQGVPLAAAQDLVAEWRDHYDWRRFERRINVYPQFLTNIDGLDFHFIHVKSRHPNALPLVLTHGWPGSFVEFLDLIGPLTDPTAHGGNAEDAFHVVIPSLPGFGFSGKPADSGWNAERTARAWTTLMGRLGYGKWVAQGGDWGATVTTRLGIQAPPGLAAVHLNWQFVFPEKMPEKLSPQEQRAVDGAARFTGDGFGYFTMQVTRPQKVGYLLSDSPLAQAMFIYEKFHTWTDNHGKPEDALDRTAMLDDISLYWFTDSGGSSARFYHENTNESVGQGQIHIPAAVSVFPHEIFVAPKSWVQAKYTKLIYFNELDKGGHFAAWEQPVIFVQELRKAFSTVR